MWFTIKLDDEMAFRTVEICDERADRMLPAELVSAEPAIA
jgi:hypothetical protein